MQEDKKPPKYLRIHLDLDGISAPALKALQLASDTVLIGLNALQEFDFANPPTVPGAPLGLKFRQKDFVEDDWRQECMDFLTRKGFQELAKGLKETLEQAYLVIHLSRFKAEQITVAKLQELRSEIHAKANRANVPTLVEWINNELGGSLKYADMVTQVQKVRSCLEHRDGVVGEKDINSQDGTLKLTVPTLKVMVELDGDKYELMPGQKTEKGSSIAPEVTEEILEFILGEKIKIGAAQFNYFAISNSIFSQDLVKQVKLLLKREGNVNME